MMRTHSIKRGRMPGLGSTGIARIAKAIKLLDPEGTYVELDVDARSVSYSPEIVQHEDIVWGVGEEEVVRAYLVSWLCTKGGYLPANLELEKSYSMGRPKVGAQLDILITRPDGTPYALIELKSPSEWSKEADKFIKGQLFGIAPHEPGASVLAFATVEANVKKIKIQSTTIAYSGQSFDDWVATRASSGGIPISYGEPVHEHYARDTSHDLDPSLSRPELEKFRKRLHDVLWRGSKPDNLVYEYVVKLFLAKIFDEKTTISKRRYRFQVYFTGNSRESTTALFSRINKLYIKAYDRYLNIDGRTRPEPLNEAAFSADQIAFVVELLQGISLTSTDETGGDLLGGFFEGITRDGFKQSKGLFFTHLNIAVFLLSVLDVAGLAQKMIKSSMVYSERLPYIIDPSCGSGTFLLAAMHIITRSVMARRATLAANSDISEFLDEKFPAQHPNVWGKDFIFGIDDSELLAMSTKVNMVLHRDGNTHIYRADGLAPFRTYTDQRLKPTAHPYPTVYSKPICQSFDVLVTNPPFSITLDPHTSSAAEATFELARNTNSENLFLERWYQLLKPGGRLGAVLPESFFATRENLQARLFLFDHFDVKAIVSLPRHAFEPWTPTRTSLLFARKKSPSDEEAWMKKRVGHEAAATQNLNDGEAAVRRLRRVARAFSEDGAVLVAAAEIEQALGVNGAAVPSLTLERPSELIAAVDDYESLRKGAVGAGERDVSSVSNAVVERGIQTLSKLADEFATGVTELGRSLKALDLPNAEIHPQCTISELYEAVAICAEHLKQVNIPVWAFRRLAPEFDYAFAVLSTTNIGYKRTRRAEYARANDLFRAVIDETGTHAPNLNLAEGRWNIKVSSSAPDALSLLRKRKLWD